MQKLWEECPRALVQLYHALKEEPGWSKSTVNTLLGRMVDKGIIYYEEGIKAKHYYPAIQREDAALAETESLLQRVYQGSVSMMMNTLVKQNALSDEGTFIRLGEEKREAYGRTLIEMTTDRTKRTRLIYCATGMINGKKEIKRRITAIAFYQKPVVWIAVLAVVLAVFLSACTAGADKQDAMEETNEQGISLQLASDVVMNADGSFRFSEY